MLSGCGRIEPVQRVAGLRVVLVTDYEPGREFSSVHTHVSAGVLQAAEVSHDVRWDPKGAGNLNEGVVVADVQGLPLGDQTVNVRLMNDSEGVVDAWSVPLFFRGQELLTVVLSRGCDSLGCLRDNGLPCNQCVNGQCIDRDGSTGVERGGAWIAGCGLQACTQDEECPVTALCADSRCIHGMCLQVIKPLGCDPLYFCNPDPSVGCESVVAPECGQICFPGASECTVGFVDCTTGTPICSDVTHREDGTPCSGDGWCDGRGGCEIKLRPTDSEDTRLFGLDMFEMDGQLFVNGRQQVPMVEQGVLFVYEVENSTDPTLRLVQKIEPSDQAAQLDFGDTFAGEGGWLAVGASQILMSGPGATYIFQQDGLGGWHESQKLVPADGLFGDEFGGSLSISGQWLAVGAADHAATGSQSGAVYMYENVAGFWHFRQKLVPLDNGANHIFGTVVAVHGEHLVATAPGADAAYTYQKVGGMWVEDQKLNVVGHEDGDDLVWDGSTLLVGASDNGAIQGYIAHFEYDGVNWAAQPHIVPSLSLLGDKFGGAFRFNGLQLASAAEGASSTGAPVYLFVRKNNAWVEQRSYVPEDSTVGSGHGIGLAITEDLLFVSAPQDGSPMPNHGSVYVYHL